MIEKIDFEDKEFTRPKSEHTKQLWAEDVNKIKRVTNVNADELSEHINNTALHYVPEYTLSEITANKVSLLKDGVSVKEIDLSIYIDDTNLARLVSGTVDGNGIATFSRDDNSTFTVDFGSFFSHDHDDRYLLLTGGDLTGILTTENLYVGSTSGFAGAKFFVNRDENGTGNVIGSFMDITQSSDQTGSNYLYAQIIRSIFDGSGEIGDMWGSQIIGRHKGSGNVGNITALHSLADYEGSGNVDNLYSAYNITQIQGSGSPSIQAVLGTWSKVEVDNSNAEIVDLYGAYSNIDIKAGKVENATVHFLDLDFLTTNQSNVELDNLYFIKTKNEILPEVSGEAFFIKSEVELPSYFKGIIETDVEVAEIENARENVLVTRKYLESKISDSDSGTIIGSVSIVQDDDSSTLDLIPTSTSVDINYVRQGKIVTFLVSQINFGSLSVSGDKKMSGKLEIDFPLPYSKALFIDQNYPINTMFKTGLVGVDVANVSVEESFLSIGNDNDNASLSCVLKATRTSSGGSQTVTPRSTFQFTLFLL